MKALHRPDLFGWSQFDEPRNLDFHSVAWIRPGRNVLIDPLPMREHDVAHLAALGGASLIVITNSDHTRAGAELATRFGAQLCGPAAERERFPLPCEHWLEDGEVLVPGMTVRALAGSKTPGELALVLEDTTLIAGDLLRGHIAGKLNLLPEAKLSDPAAARASIARILHEHPRLDAVLVGDGWPVFRGAESLLRALL
jgi:Metallo-beta-lactamase superfamily